MDVLIAFYLILFPFGKLTWFIPDLLVCLIVLLNFRKARLNSFLLICIFSLIFSLSFFKLNQLLTGFLYLARLIAYFTLINIKYKNKKFIFNSLIAIGIFVALFGWIQYLLMPDIRFLKLFGWDDHYFRLVSTFLDPAFTGIILVLAEILVLVKTVKVQTKLNYFLNLFLLITILFTYSRASFLALISALVFLLIKFRKKFILYLIVLFLFLIPVLPKASSEGTNLVRTYSINAKFTNYDESISLIKKSPIFGIGFNNVCIATTKNFISHSCSGLDNSVLFIVATTGIVGLIVFIDFIYKIIKNTKFDLYGWGLIASFIALLVHGMFTNTFFYNFILGWIAILVGVTRKIKD